MAFLSTSLHSPVKDTRLPELNWSFRPINYSATRPEEVAVVEVEGEGGAGDEHKNKEGAAQQKDGRGAEGTGPCSHAGGTQTRCVAPPQHRTPIAGASLRGWRHPATGGGLKDPPFPLQGAPLTPGKLWK